jgi:response regulator of citrate/malate metabolism
LKSIAGNLLIVEDNFFIGKNIVNATKQVNGINHVCLTGSLQEAISILDKNHFDLLILDLKLPDGNGIELLKWLKEKEKKTKVFVFSISLELQRICLEYGAFAFFGKANGLDELIESLKKLD